MLNVRNMQSERSGREVANQFIITGEGRTIFQSYDSTIAEINDNETAIVIYPSYNYSKTTAKYRNKFFEDEGFHGLATTKGLEEAISDGQYGPWIVKKIS